MKIKNINKYLILALIAVIVGACTSTEVDSKFDQTPTERLNARKVELNDLLLSSELGWKAVYYTDSTQLGGFTHVFKFLPEGKVDMASDFDDDTTIHRSQYDIQVGSTVSLVFTTNNRIHLLSDAANFPTASLLGKGYLGDFQFYYYGQENGEIIFRTNRNGHELRFVKATADDWTNLAGGVVTNQNITGDATSPLFRLVEINDGSSVQQYNFDFNAAARFGIAESLTSNDSFNLALSYTPTGAVVKPAVVVKGQKLTNFVYDAATSNFVATGTGGVTATIKFTNTPPILTDDYKMMLPGRAANRFGYYPDDYIEDAPTNSVLFYEELENINASLPAGQSISSIQLYTNHALGNFIYYTFVGRAAIFHYVDVIEDAAGKKVILKHKSWNGNTTVAAPPFLASFDSHLTDPNGIYVKQENFKLGYTNIIYTLTSSSSSFRMSVWQL